jgi:hypothetical protein
MFSRTPRWLRLCTASVALAAIVFAFTFVGQGISSSSSPRPLTAMKSTAFRVALSGDRKAQAQHKEAVAAYVAALKTSQLNQYVAALKAAQLNQYVTALQNAKLGTYLRAVSAAEQAQRAATAAPVSQPVAASSVNSGSWAAVAMCEEGGNDDPNYGYYGIKEWNGFDGYPSAGAAPQSVQLEWEQQNVGSPPDESGGCHSY